MPAHPSARAMSTTSNNALYSGETPHGTTEEAATHRCYANATVTAW
jgi:hypothetical protein